MHELGHAMGFAASDAGVMREVLGAGQRLAVRLHDEEGAHAAEPEAPASRKFVIDWAAAPAAAGKRPLAALGAQRPDDWQLRFVNQLGASSQRLNPNSALQVKLPAASRVSAV